MTEALGVEKGRRPAVRLGYCSGYYGGTLVTRSTSWCCARRQDRRGCFSTELFERYQRR